MRFRLSLIPFLFLCLMVAIANAVLVPILAARSVLRWPEPARIMALIVLVVGAGMLAGCGTLDGKMQNRITPTLACDRAFTAHLFGPVGITTEIDKRDVEQLPCAAREKAVAAPPVAPASAAK